MAPDQNPTTADLDLGRGLTALLTRKDRIFQCWAERVNLADILAPAVEPKRSDNERKPQ